MAGYTDTDKGMKNILEEIKKLKTLSVKAGITEGAGGEVAQYAAYNEFGVKGPPVSQHGDPGGWRIPPRPFIRGWIDNHRENIQKVLDSLHGGVVSGKMDAETAVGRLGEFAVTGIKKQLKHGDYRPNADSTIEKKGSSRPLIDTGTMRNSIRYEIQHSESETTGVVEVK